ncbi:DNA-binding protein inhibitor ID-1 [Tachyglossus aculeatus]|uniref:DNA-binding protein inhibitor ID-1 n=1 Tax=Tachyglossus aculeatus TaxID=9261 RepID=UPI0018F3AC1F|nr:DNA-binding protein inhibitor ID-1 [Tachyglossus aculeatus]
MKASPGAGTSPGASPSDMKGCYSRLEELVPTLPQGRRVSRVELLQHVIDYIWDLQLELGVHDSAHARHDDGPGARDPGAPDPGHDQATRVGADDRIPCR